MSKKLASLCDENQNFVHKGEVGWVTLLNKSA